MTEQAVVRPQGGVGGPRGVRPWPELKRRLLCIQTASPFTWASSSPLSTQGSLFKTRGRGGGCEGWAPMSVTDALGVCRVRALPRASLLGPELPTLSTWQPAARQPFPPVLSPEPDVGAAALTAPPAGAPLLLPEAGTRHLSPSAHASTGDGAGGGREPGHSGPWLVSRSAELRVACSPVTGQDAPHCRVESRGAVGRGRHPAAWA